MHEIRVEHDFEILKCDNLKKKNIGIKKINIYVCILCEIEN